MGLGRSVYRPQNVRVMRMDDKIILTVFTDPMMGLSYESEPIMERLEKEYAGRIEIRYKGLR